MNSAVQTKDLQRAGEHALEALELLKESVAQIDGGDRILEWVSQIEVELARLEGDAAESVPPVKHVIWDPWQHMGKDQF